MLCVTYPVREQMEKLSTYARNMYTDLHVHMWSNLILYYKIRSIQNITSSARCIRLHSYVPYNHMDVSENRGTPKCMVYKKNPIKMDDLGVA